MSPPTKPCPKCSAPMQMYTIAGGEERSYLGQQLAFDAVAFVVLVVLAGVLAGFGASGLTVAIVVAPLITLVLFWRVLARDRADAIAERGRYYCGACWQHFEGNELKQITQ